MEFRDYIKYAQRTSSAKAPSDKIEQGILGMCGELGEIMKASQEYTCDLSERARAELKKEFGDFAWYLAEFAVGVSRGDGIGTIELVARGYNLTDMVIACAAIADAYKKYMFQGHELDRDSLKIQTAGLLVMLERNMHYYGFNPSDVYEANIEKLKRRYPNGFDAERSINRED